MAKVPGAAPDEGGAVDLLHGVRVEDPFRWLEDAGDPRVRAWEEARGAEARATLNALPGREELRRRLQESLGVGNLGPSVLRGEKRFFSRRARGGDQEALWVAEAVGERLLLDPGPGTTALDWWHASGDGSLVAYALSQDGGEDSTLHLLRVADAVTLPDRVEHCWLAAFAFEPDVAAILSSRYPDPAEAGSHAARYQRRLWRHVIGTDADQDQLLFGDGLADDEWIAAVSVSASGAWTVVSVRHGWTRYSLHLRQGGGRFETVFDGPDAAVEPWFAGDRLLALTNLDAPNRRLVEIDPQAPDAASWNEVVAEGPNLLLGVAFHAGGMLLHHLREASSVVTSCDPAGTPIREVALPPHSTVTGIAADPDQEAVYLTVESFALPPRTLTLEGQVVDQVELPPGFDPGRYPLRQVWFTSADGTRAPMFLLGRERGSGAALLTGYGGFNYPWVPRWDPSLVPFLEAGGLFCLATLRGGAEFGESWHRAGIREQKQHVFDDFQSAAQWLIEQGLTTPRQLGIKGASNGGLLVGASMTQRPDLFGAVICQVGLLDMVRWDRFAPSRLWTSELGSPDDAEGFSWLHAYSPYHHVREGVPYPPLLLTVAQRDYRVDPVHGRKMAARMRQARTDAVALLRVEEKAGHGMGKPASSLVEEEVDLQSFLWWACGQPTGREAGRKGKRRTSPGGDTR